MTNQYNVPTSDGQTVIGIDQDGNKHKAYLVDDECAGFVEGGTGTGHTTWSDLARAARKTSRAD